jgi:hypothetical protein
VRHEELYAKELERLPLEDVIEQMKHSILVRPVNASPLEFEIGFDYQDPNKSQRVVSALTRVFVDQAVKAGRIVSLDVRNPPGNAVPLRPYTTALPIAGILTGALIGFSAALARRQRTA